MRFAEIYQRVGLNLSSVILSFSLFFFVRVRYVLGENKFFIYISSRRDRCRANPAGAFASGKDSPAEEYLREEITTPPGCHRFNDNGFISHNNFILT